MSSALDIVRKQFPDVTKIVDLRRPMKMEVTSKDVSKSKKKDHNNCAMAEACKRKLKLDGVIVSINRGYLIKGKKAIRFNIPESVSREIISFDRGAEFAPGDYRLDPIPKTQRLGTSSSDKRNHPRNRPNVKMHKTDNIRAVLS